MPRTRLRRLWGLPEDRAHRLSQVGRPEAHLYEPELNPVYAAFARHAGFVPLPCLPGKPEHKGKTENAIGYTQDNALKGLRFESIEAQNAHLRHWNRTWARTRIHGTTRKQVCAVFLAEERPALQPLVLAPFPIFKIGSRKVHSDGHVAVERGYYPVPARFAGKTVMGPPPHSDGISQRRAFPTNRMRQLGTGAA